MSDVTQILQQIEEGDPSAAEQLLPLVYDELRKLAAARMAAESRDHTLQATALVHEAYLRLVNVDLAQHWDSRAHFLAAAAEAMRRILVEQARSRRRIKRGGDRNQLAFSEELAVAPGPDFDLLALDEALARLAAESPAYAKTVELRYFGGMTVAETANAIGVSIATAERYLTYARAWLFAELRRDAER